MVQKERIEKQSEAEDRGPVISVHEEMFPE